MHDTAMMTGKAFLQLYGAQFGPGRQILDVGSRDVNGTLRPFAGDEAKYLGVDLQAGPGVDVVLQDPYKLPFPAASFDLVLSTSCLEHDPLFWLTFEEMARVTRIGGFIYLSVPVQGEVHRHPLDCWRFYPDAGVALVVWAGRRGHPVRLVESFQMPPREDQWVDFVAVFERCRVVGGARISDRFPEAKELISTAVGFEEANRKLAGREPTAGRGVIVQLREAAGQGRHYGAGPENAG